MKSTYNHVRYRLGRPVGEGGRDLPEEEAEERARQYLTATFLSGGAFRIAGAGVDELERAVADGHGFSLEDALEYRVWLSARTGKAAPTLFVTRDRDFPEGAHPVAVVEELRRIGILTSAKARRR